MRAQHIGFGVGPRINAVGRMGGAEDAVRLLLTRDPREAQALMARVEALNLERREIQKALARACRRRATPPSTWWCEPDAHKGVIGIVAGQPHARSTGRPSAVGTVLDGIAHCSVRAPEGYDLRPALELLRPYLLSGGGHRCAAGLTFPIGRLGFIRKTLERVARSRPAAHPPRPFWWMAPAPPWHRPRPTWSAWSRSARPSPNPCWWCAAGWPRRPGLSAPATASSGWRASRPSSPCSPRDGGVALEGELCLAVSLMDSARWGRSWRVDSFLAPAEAP